VGAAGVELYWYKRGENASKERRDELRKVAQSRAAALVKGAKARIERDSLEFQNKLLAGALTTATARTLLDGLPAIESLMPPLDIAEFKLLGNSGNSTPEEEDL
jgi:adenylate kinase